MPELELEELEQLVEEVHDDTEGEFTVVKNFQIDSYGADYTVDGLVQRMNTGAFFVPPFQRSYVWNQKQASRFIESLLLGLPVPGTFVFKDDKSGKHLIIDGQQRLKTLQFYFAGVFLEGRTKDRVFRLTDVREGWSGRRYEDLEEPDRLRLNDSIIHTIVFTQRHPADDDQSVYEVFERINTTGVKLSDQEVRACVNFGPFNSLLQELNENPAWRRVYGPHSERLKDQEMILRFLTIFHDLQNYARPMKTFLNKFMKKYSSEAALQKKPFAAEFTTTIEFIDSVLGDRAFRPEKQLNAAVFDAVMVGLASRLAKGTINDAQAIQDRYESLLRNEEFKDAYTKSTADVENVRNRVRLATMAFADVV